MVSECCDCREGEHDNYEDDVQYVIVRDPDTGYLHRKAYLCEEHREMYASDGYKIEYI